jgi:TIR domain-containing protein
MSNVADAVPWRYVIFAGSCEAVAPRKAVLVLCLVFPVAIGLASWRDQTLFLQGDDAGFFEHLGAWVFFVTTPFMIVLTARLLQHFLDILRSLKASFAPDVSSDDRDRLSSLLEWHRRSLCLRGRSVYALEMITAVMVITMTHGFFVAARPIEIYGHDVFDSSLHPWGYFATKTYALLVFGLTYPVVLFVAIHVTASLISVFRAFHEKNALQIDFTHADNCGGTARFGAINQHIIRIYGGLFLCAAANYVTHGRLTVSSLLSLGMFTLMLLAQWVGGVYYIHLSIAARKRERLQLVSSRLKEAERAAMKDGVAFPVGLLEYRKHLLSVSTFPYGPRTEAGPADVGANPVEQPATPAAPDRPYDVCFSFAGENREYVQAVADVAMAHGLRVFYDAYEKVDLWGKDLYQHLTEVYQKKAAYCAIFISSAYASKLWTKHELRAVQARAFTENEEYILPARFDDTSIPGILPTTGYIDLTKHSPEQFADLLVQKIRSRSGNAPRPRSSPAPSPQNS